MKLWMWAVLGVSTLLLFPRLCKFIYMMGFHKTVYPHRPGPCRLIKGFEEGSEDIHVMSDGIAFMSTGLKFFKKPDDPIFKDRIGRIFTFDYNQPTRDPIQQSIDWNGKKADDFNPHGITVWKDSNKGHIYLYVINHRPEGETIDKFLWNRKEYSLKLLRRISSDPTFTHLNDLVAVGEDQFYFTNLLYMPWPFGELALRLYWGSVGYFDGQAGKILVDRLLLPNGINISPDGRYVYVAHIGDQELITFEVQKDRGLIPVQNYPVYTTMDNLMVDDKTGHVWGAGGPLRYKGMKYHINPIINQAPSQVLKFHVVNGLIENMTEIYTEHGDTVSGSSVAAYHDGQMLVGTICHRALYCQVLVQ